MKGSIKVLSKPAVKPLIMDSVTTSLNTYRRHETRLSPEEQNGHCEAAQKPHVHGQVHTGHFSSRLGVGWWSGEFQKLQSPKGEGSLYTYMQHSYQVIS